jgi:branched-chain amino acid transport system ATP-binding protein
MVEPLLEVKDLVAGYDGTSVLRGVSLTVTAGAIVAVLGANGVGKTTLNKALSGIVRPQQGEVTFDGRRIDRANPADIVAAGLVHVPEGRRLFPDLSVRENLELGSYRRGKAERARSMEEVLTVFPRLKERFGQRAATLSGGEQQMVAIGRGLACAPKLLMLDEPSMGLAPAVADTIFERISQIHREDGVTILLVEQRVAEALELSDHGYVLETGHMVLDGTYETLLADDRVRRSYLGLTDA